MIRVETDKDNLDREVGEDLAAFEAWFVSLGNDALVKPETAILKTYLWYKTVGPGGTHHA